MSNAQDDPRRDLAPAHESLVEAALDSFDRPSRAAVWAQFAAAALAVVRDGSPLGAPDAAAVADALLAEYDTRFP
ncbi:MAG TPA: hypothetical protein VFD90_08370 [Gaiellales bacterium]|nr:hypothetical protein [Gaiellales bacterium]